MIIEALARLLATSAMAGTRASLTLLCLAIAARIAGLDAPAEWMSSNVGLALLFALVVVEEFAEQDEDLQALFDVFAYALRGGAGALAAGAIQSGAASADLELPGWTAALIGAALATGTHHLRARLHAQLVGFGDELLNPRRWLARLELGGVVGVMLAITLAPVLAAAFVLAASFGGAMAIAARRVAEDRVHRRDCPHCGARVRVEAQRCPKCRNAVEITRRADRRSQ